MKITGDSTIRRAPEDYSGMVVHISPGAYVNTVVVTRDDGEDVEITSDQANNPTNPHVADLAVEGEPSGNTPDDLIRHSYARSIGQVGADVEDAEYVVLGISPGSHESELRIAGFADPDGDQVPATVQARERTEATLDAYLIDDAAPELFTGETRVGVIDAAWFSNATWRRPRCGSAAYY